MACPRRPVSAADGIPLPVPHIGIKASSFDGRGTPAQVVHDGDGHEDIRTGCRSPRFEVVSQCRNGGMIVELQKLQPGNLPPENVDKQRYGSESDKCPRTELR